MDKGSKIASGVEIEQAVGKILEEISGFVALCRIDAEDVLEILRLESGAERRVVLGAIPAENEGVKEALEREAVYAVAYRPKFFEGFKDRLHGSSVVMMAGGDVVGEEVIDVGRLRELKGRSDVILVGSSFVLYKDKLRRAKGEAKIVLPARTFPPLEHLKQVRDVVSGSPSSPVDHYLKLKMHVDTEDPEIGTVITGFNLRRRG